MALEEMVSAGACLPLAGFPGPWSPLIIGAICPQTMGDQVFNLRGPLDLSWEVGFVKWGGEGLSGNGSQQKGVVLGQYLSVPDQSPHLIPPSSPNHRRWFCSSRVSPMGQQLNVNECLNMKLGWLVLLVNTGVCQIGMSLCLTLVLPP